MIPPAGVSPGVRPAGAERRMRRSVVRDLLARAAAPEVLSFAVGLPATGLIPRQALAAVAESLLAASGAPLQYGTPYRPLKTHIVRLMRERGVECAEEQVFLCNGAQQGLRLLSWLLLAPGAPVMHEEIVYDGFQTVISDFSPEVLAVPTRAGEGIDAGAVAARLAAGARPAFLYVVSDGHNPLGVSLSPETRSALVGLARSYEVPIVEDDACGLLGLDGPPPPPLRALDADWVLYVGSFSKILAPGLRVGWVVVPERLVPALSALKHADDFDTASFSQHLVAGFLDRGELPAHLALLRREYARRRDAVLDACARHLPEAARWTCPPAGLYVWVEIPAVDTMQLLEAALEEEKVAFCPGIAFAAPGRRDGWNAMRLSFGGLAPEKIEEAIARLGRVTRKRFSTPGPSMSRSKVRSQGGTPC